MQSTSRREKVTTYYQEKLKTFGPTHQGVDWNTVESQVLRFSKLAQLFSGDSFSVIDYGCGYGAFLDYLQDSGKDYKYTGFDWSEEMVAEARKIHPENQNQRFVAGNLQENADYVVASGIFNVKLDDTDENWKQYMLSTIGEFDKLSTKGFAFNVLTSYSDVDKRSPKLYYAEPLELFDFCKKHFAANVALLHDYGFYEFTILVRK